MYSLHSDDSPPLQDALRTAIVAFNNEHFDAQRIPLGFKFIDENQQLVAGTTAQLFGNWLMISWLWCDEAARGQGLAQRLLDTLERAGRARGAKVAQLDTLDFQAKPFYEKNGYVVKYQMDNYPLTGTRYFMEKAL